MIRKFLNTKIDKHIDGLNFHKSWGELFALFLLFGGFVVAFRLEYPFVAYFVISLFAFLFGRIYYVKRRTQSILASVLAILAFIIGFVAGSFNHSRIFVILLFLFFFFLSYWLHMKEYLVIFKSESFLK